MAWSVALKLAGKGELVAALDADEDAGARAAALVIRRTTTLAKNAGRKLITGAGLGGIKNTLRGETTPPRGPTWDAVGQVSSKLSKKRRGGFVDLLEVFEEGAVINARGTTFLAIPNKKLIGRQGKSRMTPTDYPKGTFDVRIRGDHSKGWLVFKDGRGVGFTLLRTVTIKKRLPNLSEALAHYGDDIDAKIVAEWERQSARAGDKLGIG